MGSKSSWLFAFPTKVSEFLVCGLPGSAKSVATHRLFFSIQNLVVASFPVLQPFLFHLQSYPSDPFKNHICSSSSGVLGDGEVRCGSMCSTLTMHHPLHGCLPACLIDSTCLCYHTTLPKTLQTQLFSSGSLTCSLAILFFQLSAFGLPKPQTNFLSRNPQA